MRFCLLGSLALAAAGAGAQGVPEPSGYRLEDYRSATPDTLQGAIVLDSQQAEALWKSGAAAFVDVLPRPPKPTNLPAGTLWRDMPRPSVPGAVWLPNVGFGALAPEAVTYFRNGLAAASGGDRDKRLVFFCLRHCWMSWNAAKRAMAQGYRRVLWFPEGTDGWSQAGLPLEPAEPWQ